MNSHRRQLRRARAIARNADALLTHAALKIMQGDSRRAARQLHAVEQLLDFDHRLRMRAFNDAKEREARAALARSRAELNIRSKELEKLAAHLEAQRIHLSKWQRDINTIYAQMYAAGSLPDAPPDAASPDNAEPSADPPAPDRQ